MPFASKLTSNGHQTTGDLNTNVAGTNEPMATLSMNRVMPGSLSAHCLVDIETTSITVALNWQVSVDGSTWVDMAHQSQNPAAVILGTGTGGADPSITRVVPAPSGVYAYPFCRAVLTNAGATGTTSDTYTVGYSYLRGSSF